MNAETWNVVTGILTALGGGGLIVAAFSGWLGKLWAEKLMAKEKARHDAELTSVRVRLESEATKNLTHLQHQLDIFKETHIKGLSDKLTTYRMAVDAIADMTVDITLNNQPSPVSKEVFELYQRRRLKAFGYISMIGSQEVLDTFAYLTDYLQDIAEGKTQYNRTELRKRTFPMIDALREHVGINTSEVQLGSDYSLPSKNESHT